MKRVAEKPDLINIKAVKVWAQAGMERLSELEKPYFHANFRLNGRENEFP